MAEALAIVEYRVIHVSSLPGNTAEVVGNCNMEDGPIAKWCADHQHVLVTMDTDFRGRWVRSGLLAKHGVEVIVFKRDLAGLAEQHLRVSQHLRHWIADLGAGPYAHRVWEQTVKTRPTLHFGPKPK